MLASTIEFNGWSSPVNHSAGDRQHDGRAHAIVKASMAPTHIRQMSKRYTTTGMVPGSGT